MYPQDPVLKKTGKLESKFTEYSGYKYSYIDAHYIEHLIPFLKQKYNSELYKGILPYKIDEFPEGSKCKLNISEDDLVYVYNKKVLLGYLTLYHPEPIITLDEKEKL